MSELFVGDRVVVKETHIPYAETGKKGTITAIDTWGAYVTFDESGVGGRSFVPGFLELISVSASAGTQHNIEVKDVKVGDLIRYTEFTASSEESSIKVIRVGRIDRNEKGVWVLSSKNSTGPRVYISMFGAGDQLELLDRVESFAAEVGATVMLENLEHLTTGTLLKEVSNGGLFLVDAADKILVNTYGSIFFKYSGDRQYTIEYIPEVSQ